MKDRLTSKKFILAILGLITMVVTPEVAPYVVGLLTVAIVGQTAVDFKKESKKGE